MSDLIELVKALLGLMFDVRSFKAKNWVFECDHYVGSSSFNVRKMKFEFEVL